MGGVGVTEFRPSDRRLFRRPRRSLGAVLVLGSLLAGCASPSLPSFSSMFGSSTPAGGANASAANTLPSNFECPTVAVRSGASTLTSAADGGEPTTTNMRYQVGINTTARECRGAPGNMVSIKVGVQGRVILGPQGVPGTVDVPIRYAVVFDGVPQRTVVTRLERISVTIPPDDTNVLFSHVVDGLEFPMPKGAEIDSYVVYIGFDPIAAQQMDRRRPAPRPARPSRGQMSQAPPG
jgi:hypothetical protein